MGNQGISAVAGSDILNINGTIISGHADGDAYKIEPQGPIGEMKVSKDGNSIYALQYTGIKVKLTVRLVRDCADDVFLNGLLQQWIASPNTFPLLFAEYIKSTGDGKGNVTNEVYVLSGGIFEMIPSAVSNMDGNTEQSVTVYTLWFRNDARLMT
jgi:hypothetical protein